MLLSAANPHSEFNATCSHIAQVLPQVPRHVETHMLFLMFVVLNHGLMPGNAAIPHPTREDVAPHWVGCLRIETTNPPAANIVVCTAASELESPRKLLCPRAFHDANFL